MTVKYETDQSGTYTTLGTMTSADGGDKTFTVSTSSSPVDFIELRLRLEFAYGSTSDEDETPVLYAIETRAAVLQQVKVWDAVVDLADGASSREPLRGYQLAENIQNAAAAKATVDFKNGFYSNKPDTYQQHDVIIDAYEIEWQKAGQGFAVLRLIESI